MGCVERQNRPSSWLSEKSSLANGHAASHNARRRARVIYPWHGNQALPPALSLASPIAMHGAFATDCDRAAALDRLILLAKSQVSDRRCGKARHLAHLPYAVIKCRHPASSRPSRA
jgi:hypothetical protein